ncbi:hypothetical protein OSJ57_11725 [Sphingomonas sp. HH69]
MKAPLNSVSAINAAGQQQDAQMIGTHPSVNAPDDRLPKDRHGDPICDFLYLFYCLIMRCIYLDLYSLY